LHLASSFGSLVAPVCGRRGGDGNWQMAARDSREKQFRAAAGFE
jgi:hypothetical protein